MLQIIKSSRKIHYYITSSCLSSGFRVSLSTSSIMASSGSINLWVFALAVACISIHGCILGEADEDVPPVGAAGDDPAQIVAKALLCFNDRNTYISCEESYRLSASGNLNVPYWYTDQFCTGPCLKETHLVLNCIEDILAHFLFYNKATIQDIRDTIKAGCGHGPERGNFNVAEHIQAEEGTASKAAVPVLSGICLMNIGLALLL